MGKWLVIVFWSISFGSFAQILEGTVYNENKKPLVGAVVYLDGTTFSSNTDANGKYSIITNGKINTILVISFIGYETFFVANPFENNNLQISLSVKTEKLKEVVIKKDFFSRKDKLKIFREYFLGLTDAGKSCKIVNEDDIDFEYDYNKNVLNARSDVPLVIKNEYLGYDVQFDLNEFNVKFNKKSIVSYDVVKSLFLGTALFTDVTKEEKMKSRRNKAYLGSSMHFFKNLVVNIWDKDNFLVFKRSFQFNPNTIFKVENFGDLNQVTVLINDIKDIKIVGQNPKFYTAVDVLYKKKHQSRIIFTTGTFYIDNFGNNSNVQDIEYSGVLSIKKMGDLLPLNFEFETAVK